MASICNFWYIMLTYCIFLLLKNRSCRWIGKRMPVKSKIHRHEISIPCRWNWRRMGVLFLSFVMGCKSIIYKEGQKGCSGSGVIVFFSCWREDGCSLVKLYCMPFSFLLSFAWSRGKVSPLESTEGERGVVGKAGIIFISSFETSLHT